MGKKIARVVGIALMTCGGVYGVVYAAYRYCTILLVLRPHGFSGGFCCEDWGHLAVSGILFFVGMVVYAEVTYEDPSEK